MDDLENRAEYDYGFIGLQIGQDLTSYEFQIEDDSIFAVERDNDVITKRQFTEDGKYSYYSYYVDTDEVFFSSETSDCTRSDFISQYVDYSSVKLNLDWNGEVRYSRSEMAGVSGGPDQWKNHLSFGEGFQYDASILGVDI